MPSNRAVDVALNAASPNPIASLITILSAMNGDHSFTFSRKPKNHCTSAGQESLGCHQEPATQRIYVSSDKQRHERRGELNTTDHYTNFRVCFRAFPFRQQTVGRREQASRCRCSSRSSPTKSLPQSRTDAAI